MKRFLLIITICLGLAETAGAGYRTGYYDRMDGKQKESLKSAAKSCVAAHQTLVYSQLPGYWQYTDVYPELVNNAKRWWDMYSDEVCLIAQGQTAFQSFSSYGMQREHSVPKSWWKQNGSVEYTPAYSDLWNLYPSNGPANQAKSNYPFGPTDNPAFNNGVTRVGTPKSGYGGGAPRVFEPDDEYKGDFARTVFYMATVYDDINWVINYMFRKEAYPTLVPWAVNMLLQWSRQDRVSQKEIDRNNLVEQHQGNRNPFVDFPELAEYIWGVRQGEIFILADQENTDPTPPSTGDPEITEPVNGEYLDFGSIAAGHSLTRALQIKGANFTESLSVRVVGADAVTFIPETSSIPASALNATGGYLLNITYLPDEEGLHEAALILYDGGLEGSVKVNLKGSAETPPVLNPLLALEPTDITPSAYTANWLAPNEVADYYILTRIRYYDGDEETETYETGYTSLTLTDRDPAIAESYSVQYSRLGMMSLASNTIYVAADSGISMLQTKVPFRVSVIEDGIMILSGDGQPVDALCICDLQGRMVFGPSSVDHGETLRLQPGIYLLTAAGHLPRKVAIQ